ncbi:hypothetical protein SE17_38275, partial [Kouleothrix aurantiaca]
MSDPYAFDADLPALPLAFDLDRVARLFAEQWPAGGGPVTISKIKLQDTKYQPHARCVTTYALAAEQDGAARPTIGVLEITPAGAAHRLYNSDTKLPWLAQATDPEVMRAHFAALLPGTTIERCTNAPVRYRPNVRCVFRY